MPCSFRRLIAWTASHLTHFSHVRVCGSERKVIFFVIGLYEPLARRLVTGTPRIVKRSVRGSVIVLPRACGARRRSSPNQKRPPARFDVAPLAFPRVRRRGWQGLLQSLQRRS